MIKHYDIRVTGRVQGIFFRMAAKELALRLRLAGLVKNEPDGSVSLAVEGEPSALAAFVDWCRRGPEQATVKEVTVAEGAISGAESFRIL